MEISCTVPGRKDIGPLDATIRLPMASRLKYGVKTVCAVCGKPITDEFFLGGFKKRHRNLMLHEACADEQALSVLRK